MALRVPKAELPSELREKMIEQLGVVPDPVAVVYNNPDVALATLEFSARVAAWDAVDASLVDYMIPSASEVPFIDVVHIESESTVAGGFRGMGEGGTIGAPAAIANAIADALDADVSILPMTPDRVFALMGQAKLKTKGISE